MSIISWNNCLKTIASYMCTLQTSINANVSVLVSTWVKSVNQYSWFYRSSSSSRFYFIVYPIFFICETNILVYLQVWRIRTVAHLNIQQITGVFKWCFYDSFFSLKLILICQNSYVKDWGPHSFPMCNAIGK